MLQSFLRWLHAPGGPKPSSLRLQLSDVLHHSWRLMRVYSLSLALSSQPCCSVVVTFTYTAVCAIVTGLSSLSLLDLKPHVPFSPYREPLSPWPPFHELLRHCSIIPPSCRPRGANCSATLSRSSAASQQSLLTGERQQLKLLGYRPPNPARGIDQG